MAKRLTDTTKWDDDWYLGLPPELKAVWGYLCDTCDGSGVKKLSFRKLSQDVGVELTRESFERHFGERVLWLGRDKVWLTGFIRVQYKSLSPKNPAHLNIARKVLRLIGENALTERAREAVVMLQGVLGPLPPSPASPSSSEIPPETRNWNGAAPGPDRARDGLDPESSRPSRKEEIDNRKEVRGEDLRGGTGESFDALEPGRVHSVEPAKLSPEELRKATDRAVATYTETLAHFRTFRPVQDTERLRIGRAIQLLGEETVRLALLGFRQEQKTDRYDPAQFLTLDRLFEPGKRERLLSLGAQWVESRKQSAQGEAPTQSAREWAEADAERAREQARREFEELEKYQAAASHRGAS